MMTYVTMGWSIEHLPANPAAWVRFAAGSDILISILGLSVCTLCLCIFLCRFWCYLRHSVDHIFREAHPCILV